MKCIIIEGPQGCGKTSLANYLRENIAESNLYRLAGSKDKTITGKKKSKDMYYALLDYMKKIENSNVNLIFDRTFFTDQVYSLLGHKEYDFTDIYLSLLEKLSNLKYDIYYISLYLEDTNLYKERLNRKYHHNYQAFSIEESINQQNTYKNLIPEIKKMNNTRIFELKMDNFDEAYKKINEIFELKI